MIVWGTVLGQGIIAAIAVIGFLSARQKATHAAKKVEEIHILVNSQRDELTARVAALEAELKIARKAEPE
jgi:hypothetical protein